MSENKTYLPASDSLPDLILSFVALCGELSTPLISRLPGSERYKALAVNRLKEKSLIYTYYQNNLRGLRLTAAAKNTLLQLQPERRNPLDKSLTWDLAPARDDLVENDGFDDKGVPALLGHACDIPRIYKFHEGLQIFKVCQRSGGWHGKTLLPGVYSVSCTRIDSLTVICYSNLIR